jgi:hypothetical protein
MQSLCDHHGLPYAYGFYAAMYADNNVDAIYIATPPFTHYALTKMALLKGKHELCEEPFVDNEEEVQELSALNRIQGLILMEAMKAVFTPPNFRSENGWKTNVSARSNTFKRRPHKKGTCESPVMGEQASLAIIRLINQHL